MLVLRAPLPGPVTVAVLPEERLLMLGEGLTRAEAALAIVGVLPQAHPDVVEHWLDQCYERVPEPTAMLSLSAARRQAAQMAEAWNAAACGVLAAGLAAAACGSLAMVTAHAHPVTPRPVARVSTARAGRASGRSLLPSLLP